MRNVIKVAILDLNDNVENQAMRCFRELLAEQPLPKGWGLEVAEFDVRHRGQLPDTSFDVYLSTGGPGNPYDGTGSDWEPRYFALIEKLWQHNRSGHPDRKHVLFVCHSFQLMCRHFKVAHIVPRQSTSFGVYPVHQTPAARQDIIFGQLPEPFYAADFRDWQAVRPNYTRLAALGGSVLCLEKIRTHVPLERAVMAIRLSDEFLGVQFHPEADPVGIKKHFMKPEKRRQVISKYGLARYRRLIERLEDPAKIPLTHSVIIPTFLRIAFEDKDRAPARVAS